MGWSCTSGLVIANGTMSAVSAGPNADPDQANERAAQQLFKRGRQIFRFDTFGDEAFWGDALRLHEAIAGRATRRRRARA